MRLILDSPNMVTLCWARFGHFVLARDLINKFGPGLDSKSQLDHVVLEADIYSIQQNRICQIDRFASMLRTWNSYTILLNYKFA